MSLPLPESDAVEEQAEVKPPAVTESVAAAEPAEPAATPPRRGRRLRSVLLGLIVVAAAIAIGVYGWSIVNDRVAQPISDNAASVDSLRAGLEATAQDVRQLQVAVDAITAAEAGLPERLGSIESALAALAQTDQSLAGELEDATGRLDGVDRAIAEISVRLDALDGLQETTSTRLTGTNQRLEAELGVLRSMELMSRARLFLYQANYGLAEQDLAAARDLLAGLATADEPALSATVERLDMALASLPDRPVAASDDLDIAWSLLLEDIPGGAPSAAVESGDTESTTSTTAP